MNRCKLTKSTIDPLLFNRRDLVVGGYFVPMAQRVFGEAAIPEEDRLGMELARWIARTKPAQFNARETR